MDIEIDIPIPPPGKRKSALNLAVVALQVGQSIFCENNYQRDAARITLRRLGHKYATRKMDGGFRVWRTS